MLIYPLKRTLLIDEDKKDQIAFFIIFWSSENDYLKTNSVPYQEGTINILVWKVHNIVYQS